MKEDLNLNMKNLFIELDYECTLKLRKQEIRKYFGLLADKISKEQFQSVSECDDECFDQVWQEFDVKETGLLSWH